MTEAQNDDIRAKAQAVLSGQESRDAYAGDLARHVLATEARLDVALRGALQSREEMREWLGSDEGYALLVAHEPRVWREDGIECFCGQVNMDHPAHLAAALVAASPGSDV